MSKKLRNSLITITALFLIGNILVFLGQTKGNEIASKLSRPAGAVSWKVSNEMILGCTYTPILAGISLIILSLVFSAILFIKWLNY